MSGAAPPSPAVVEGQYTAAMRQGDLHVMMDVGLAGELGMSVPDLKIAILKKLPDLGVKVAQLESDFKEAAKSASLDDMMERMEKLEKSLNVAAATSASLAKVTDQLKEENTQVDQKIVDQQVQHSELKKENLRLLKILEQQNAVLDKNAEDLETLKSKFDDQANETVEEVDEGEPGIALEDQLRITEQSAKAIDLLSNHLLSTVWQPCSKNTFGDNFLHFMSF
jgi:hypothetical protein